jgi:sugar O-acyltransferase (sialic acid O-acetyltransferase NeuD family)
MIAPSEILVYGAGGFAREVAWLVQKCSSDIKPMVVGCFIDDAPVLPGKRLNDIPVLSLDEARRCHPHAHVVAAIGEPAARERVVGRTEQAGFRCASLIHPNVEMSEWVEISEGSIVCAGNILTTNIRIGRHVHVNLDCTIGHDAVLGDFTTLAPGVHISGWVHAGARVYIGTGAVVINGTAESPLRIGDDAVIGAGACVTKSVEPCTTVVGVPARAVHRSGRLSFG